MNQRKIDILYGFMKSEDWGKALKLAASWPRLGKHKAAIQKGWAAYSNPAFYSQLNYDADKLVADGTNALKERYKGDINGND